MTRRKIDPMGQRELALALRYHVDQAMKRGIQHRDIAARLIAENPTSFRSRHVQHNLGVTRLRWLADEGLAVDPGGVLPAPLGVDQA